MRKKSRRRKEKPRENRKTSIRNIRIYMRKTIEKHFQCDRRDYRSRRWDNYVRTNITQDNVINVSSNYIFTYIVNRSRDHNARIVNVVSTM